MGPGVLISRPSDPSSGGLTNGFWVVAASDEEVVARLPAEVGSGGSFSLTWSSGTLTYTQKNSHFCFEWYQFRKSKLLLRTFKEKFSIAASSQLSNINYFNKSSGMKPLFYVMHIWMHKLWRFPPLCMGICVYPHIHTHFPLPCTDTFVLCLPERYLHVDVRLRSLSSFVS